MAPPSCEASAAGLGPASLCIVGLIIERTEDVVARETKFRTEAMTSRIAQLSIVDALIANLALGSHDKAVRTIEQTFDVLSIKRF